MECVKSDCVFESGGKCGCAEIAGPGGMMDTLWEACGYIPWAAVGCSRYMPAEDGDEARECQDGACSPSGSAVGQ